MTGLNSTEYRCPRFGVKETCNCNTCKQHRKTLSSKAMLEEEHIKNTSSSGRMLSNTAPMPELKETPKERYRRQKFERFQESEKAWAYVKANAARYKQHRQAVIESRKYNLSILLESDFGIIANQEFNATLEDGTELALKTDKDGISNFFAESLTSQKIKISVKHSWIKRDMQL